MLWDVDHTLIELNRGSNWFGTAFATVIGKDPLYFPKFGGRTDRAVTMELLAAVEVEATEELIQELWTEFIAVAVRALPTLRQHGRALPGAADALSTMAESTGVVQTLVTGNLPETARHKLSAFGLHTHIDFEIGGYGSLSAYRPDLVPHAVGLATDKHATTFAADDVVVIGDTPHDIDAALQHGAVAVGVATGRFTADELHAAGAHTVLADLTDTSAVRAALLGRAD
jgi:phosphoglycolate phosphatase-like HAD superfamily hydrolase